MAADNVTASSDASKLADEAWDASHAMGDAFDATMAVYAARLDALTREFIPALAKITEEKFPGFTAAEYARAMEARLRRMSEGQSGWGGGASADYAHEVSWNLGDACVDMLYPTVN